jgi:predicted MFS family arabinose efflux permease
MISAGTQQYRNVTTALALGSFMVFCNLYLFQPLLPILAEHYQVTIIQVNWVLAASTFSLAFSLVPWAILSEMIGRKIVIIISLLLIPILGVLGSFVDNFLLLVALRVAMGVALAGFVAVAVAYMAEELTPMAFSVAIGVYISANSLGGIAGRVMGGMLTDHFGLMTAQLLFGGFSVLLGLYVIFSLPDQQHFCAKKVSVKAHIKSAWLHLKNKHLRSVMWIGGLNFALFVNLYSVMGFRLVEAPFSLPVSITSMIFICYLAGTVSSSLSGKWVRRYGAESGMVLGTLILACGLLVAWFDSIPAVVIGLCLISTGAFFTHSIAYGWIGRHAKRAKASATSLYLVHYYVGGSLGGFYLILCWQYFQWLGVMLGASLLIIAMVVSIFSLMQSQTPDPQQVNSL